MSRVALSFQSVVKDYEYSHLGRLTKTRALDGLTLVVEEGKVFGILGLNGAGKTTAMKLALGLLRPTSGMVSVFGHAPGSHEALGKIGYLPELPYFYTYLSPLEALSFYGSLSGLSAELVAERAPKALASVGLSHAAERKAKGFSKGMLQRLGLAQAILHEPKLIVLDEPVSGLDPLAVHDVRELIHKLNEEQGRSFLMSSHSISNVENLCHGVGIIAGGKLVKAVERADWAGEKGSLEKIFVAAVRPEQA